MIEGELMARFQKLQHGGIGESAATYSGLLLLFSIRSIYIYVCICMCVGGGVYWQHFIIDTYLIEHYRRFLPTYILKSF